MTVSFELLVNIDISNEAKLLLQILGPLTKCHHLVTLSVVTQCIMVSPF